MNNTVEGLEEMLKDNLIKRTKSNGNPERTLARLFKHLDVNHDGSISFNEFQKAMKPLAVGMPDHLLRGLFDKWDSDGSGGIEVGEFVGTLFKDPKERKQAIENKKKSTEEKRATSLRADDIIEQARLNREARKKQVDKYKITMAKREEEDNRVESSVRERLANRKAATRRSPQALQEELEEKVFNGPFRNGAKLAKTPNNIRYKVSNTYVSVYPPSNWDLERHLALSAELPKDTLSLSFIYGINGKCGLRVRRNGEILYASAGVGIVYDPRKHEQRFFFGHDDDITQVAMDPSEKYAATGCMGKAPKVMVWDLDTMEKVWESPTGFYDREISALGFSHANPEIIAAVGADNHHMLAVWNWRRGKLLAQAPTQNGQPPAINKLVFDDESNSNRFATCGFKHLKFWTFDAATGKLIGGKNATYGKVSSSPRETKCMIFLPKNSAISGGSNGVLYLWDTLKNTCKRAFPAHDGPVCSLLLAADNQFISAGAKDEALSYWSAEQVTEGNGTIAKLDNVQLPENSGPCVNMDFMRRGKATPVLVAASAKRNLLAFSPDAPSPWKILVGGHFGDLYGLATHPHQPTAFCTVGEDKQLQIWDAESKQLIESLALPEKAHCVAISSRGRTKAPGKELIAVGMIDGAFHVLETGTFDTIFKAQHSTKGISIVSFSPDGSKLAVGSHDSFINVYSVDDGFQHLSRLKGNTSTVTHIDWATDSTILQSTSQAYEYLAWDTERGRLIRDKGMLRDLDWDTFSCSLGFPVMGIWPDGSDGTDVNAVARTNDHRLLATGDDFGNVNLFNYPVIVEDAPCHSLKGHSSHVMNVSWLADSRSLISVGGHDRSVFQWKRISVSEAQNQQARLFDQPETDTVGRPQRQWKPKTSWK